MKDGGELRVELSLLGQEVALRVRDTGPGIAPDQLPKLFEVGFDASGARVELALGLPTVAATMNAFGGSAEAESELGCGTIITLRLPVPATMSA